MVPPTLQFGVPGGVELLILFVVLFLSFAIPLAVSLFVYRDAEARRSRHALAWGAGAFFGSVVVWVLYFVVRDEVGPNGAA